MNRTHPKPLGYYIQMPPPDFIPASDNFGVIAMNTPSQQAEPTAEMVKAGAFLDGTRVYQDSEVRNIWLDMEAVRLAAAVAQPTEAQIIRFMNELHSNVPEADRPMSMSDFSEDQIARIRRAFATIAAAPVAQPSAEPVARMSARMRDFIEGMSVSVDVSTGDHDEGHRYFGTVTEVMDAPADKHGVTLLVQDAEPNFKL